MMSIKLRFNFLDFKNYFQLVFIKKNPKKYNKNLNKYFQP